MRASTSYWSVCCLAGWLLLTAHPLLADNEEGLSRIIALPRSEGTVYELLEKVSERSGYLFIYDSSAVDNEQRATVGEGAYTIRQAIYAITGNDRLELRIEGRYILIRPPTGHFTITGTLLDRYTREPVSYATVGVAADATGTIANQNGDFRLRLPDSLRSASVGFSHLGYLTQEHEIRALSEEQPRIFLLEPKVISIQEVVVRLVNPLRLLHSMLDSREANYSAKPVYFTTFYREGVERRKGFVNLTEAVFKVYKTPYKNDPSADQVKLLKMRRISNENEEDTLITKIKSGINACLMLDLIKNLPDFLLPENERQYDYVHSDITVTDNRPANIISFEQKKEMKEPLYKGDLYIDAGNNALLAARFELNPKHIEKATDMLVTRKSRNLRITPQQVIYHVTYKDWNGTYYVSHIRGDLYFKVRKKNQLFGSTVVHTWFEMVTCKIETETVSRFTRNETLRTRTIFAETNFSYDDRFWENFNTIPPEDYLSEAISRITSTIEETGDFAPPIP